MKCKWNQSKQEDLPKDFKNTLTKVKSSKSYIIVLIIDFNDINKRNNRSINNIIVSTDKKYKDIVNQK